MRVTQLQPGDLVRSGPDSAVYIEQAPHPLYRGLRLVIWKMPDGTWSHDALKPGQDVGEAVPSTPAQRRVRLAYALLPVVQARGFLATGPVRVGRLVDE